MAGGAVHTGAPLAAKSSSDGLANEVLIWLHRALMLSASAPSDGSISGTAGGNTG